MLGIFKFFVALNSNGKLWEIAVGIAYGFWLALVPINSLLWIILFVISGFFRLNQGAVIVAALLLKTVIAPLTPLLDYAGWMILNQESLYDLFTTLRNIPFLPWTRFYNSVVMGSLILGPFLAVPAGFLGYFMVKIYRKQLRDRFLHWPFIQWLGKLPLIRSAVEKYQKASQIMSILD